ncbi:MAG: hypothetical protein AAF721_11500 [Myxococcota bacterium]
MSANRASTHRNPVRAGTWAMVAAAALAVGLAHADPWASSRVVAPLTSTQSASRRLLPTLTDVDVATATIELAPAVGSAVVLQANPAGGHVLLEGDTVLGPADPEAVEGLWASLRMATTVRAVAEGTDAGLGAGGTIRLRWPGQQRELTLGQATADEAGVYGALSGGAEGTAGVWVVENELALLLSQAPRAWLARRAVVADASHIEALAFADGPTVARGADGLWRDGTALLDPHAIETRVERVLSARMDPLLDTPVDTPVDTPAGQDAAPWVTLTDIAGTAYTLATAGSCPGRSDRVVLVRGEGLTGCIDAALVGPWPWPQLVDTRLSPHEYGAVQSIEQRTPTAGTLSRYGGGWRLEETLAGRPVATEVDEAEVFRFYTALHAAEVEVIADAGAQDRVAGLPTEVDWIVRTEHGVAQPLRCWLIPPTETRWCQRGEGPLLRVRTELPALPVSAERFSDRRVVASLSVDDVRAVEILPGPTLASDARTRRQSAHFDLGVWRLDAPEHPDGDDALDTTRLDALIAGVAGLRAAAWTSPPREDPLRIVRLEQVARSGLPDTVEVALHPGCIAVVAGRRAAEISESACRRLSADLLFDDPLSAWIDHAAALEVTQTGGATLALERVGGAWARADGVAMGTLLETLGAMQGWRAEALRQTAGDDTADDEARFTLRVRPRQGAAFEVAVGETWAQVRGADFRYVGPPVF